MCGIIAIYSKNKLDKRKCIASLNTLKKRGPDKTLHNFFESGKLFIGNTVLSITGNQKKDNELYNSKNKFIAFNGEIYNYKSLINKFFKKERFLNDTDLLVNLFGKKGISRSVNYIDGMYAVIIYDRVKKKLKFLTDPQGEKRFFIYNNNNVFIISSTIIAIKKYLGKLDINNDKKVEYLSTRHMLFYKDTFYKNILLSLPGTISELKKNTVNTYSHYNCLRFINKNKYLYFKKMSRNRVVNYFDNLLQNQVKLMIPERNFGSIVSGGVDSSLISYYLNKLSKPKIFAGINHVGKDKVIKKTFLFEKKLNKKINVIKLDQKKYYNNLKKVYKRLHFPFLTHDYVSRHIISEYFIKKKCKVFFSGDGADELFGGYKLYSKTKWTKFKNSSPYSSIDKELNTKTSKYINKLWLSANKKFLNFLKPLEASIQASLFTDYFIQGVSVANIGTDLLSGENSIETRNPFIQKKMIANAINLPIKYKINLKSKIKGMICKPLLKEIFIRKFGPKLLFSKQGFSGFPNESLNFFNKSQLKHYKNFKNELGIQSNKKAIEWKILNLFYTNIYLK